MELDQEPFLPKHLEKPESCTKLHSRGVQSRQSRAHYLVFFSLQIVLILLYIAITVVVIKQQTNFSPIPTVRIDNLAIQYKSQVQSLADKTYKGLPTPQIDEAWDRLLAPMNIRVLAEELERSNQESIALPGGGYLAWIGAFHQLHCVRLLRHIIDLDYYAPNMTVEDVYHLKSHGDHCLEMLRQSAMCGGDTSLTTFSWTEGKKRAGVNPVGYSLQKCVDWDALVSSMEYRFVSTQEYDSLVNPLDLGQ